MVQQAGQTSRIPCQLRIVMAVNIVSNMFHRMVLRSRAHATGARRKSPRFLSRRNGLWILRDTAAGILPAPVDGHFEGSGVPRPGASTTAMISSDLISKERTEVDEHRNWRGTGAMFGAVGRVARGMAGPMAAAMPHRGRTPSLRRLPTGGFAGVLDRAGRTGMITDGEFIVLACGAVYGEDEPNVATRLAAVFRDGPSGLRDLDGDFAAVRIRRRDGAVEMVRDQFGCVPLYFVEWPGAIAFATEYKALLTLGAAFTPDRAMLQHLQHAKRLPAGRTLFQQIESVPPGAFVRLEPGRQRTIDDPPALQVGAKVKDVEEATRLIRDRLSSAIRKRAADLDPLALSLSGGVDSISIAFQLRRLFPGRRILTFTAGSSVTDPECVTARAVAEAVGGEHREVIIPPGSVDPARLSELVHHLEDPVSRSESMQLFEIGRRAAEAGCGAVLIGQGADALFGGMHRHQLIAAIGRFPMASRWIREVYDATQLGLQPSSPLARLVVGVIGRGPMPAVPLVAGAEYQPPRARFPAPGPQFLNRTLAAGYREGVSQDVVKFERAFAAHGVAVRSPFHDVDLVRSAYAINDALKIRHGRGKWIFRRAAAAWVPARFRRVPKLPQRIRSDLAFARALDACLDATILRDRRREAPLYRSGELEALRRPSASRPYPYEAGMRIWTAVLTDLWMARFVDPAGPGEPPDAPL